MGTNYKGGGNSLLETSKLELGVVKQESIAITGEGMLSARLNSKMQKVIILSLFINGRCFENRELKSTGCEKVTQILVFFMLVLQQRERKVKLIS